MGSDVYGSQGFRHFGEKYQSKAYFSRHKRGYVYVRLHGSKKLVASEYSLVELQEWGRKIRDWGIKAYLYFDDDSNGFAVKNAELLKEILAFP